MVLQRLQSLYLLLAVIFLGVFLFSTSVSFTAGENKYVIGALACGPEGSALPNYALCVLNVLTAVLAFITIFKYRNLKLQLKLCSICILLTLALTASIAVLAFQAQSFGDLNLSLSNVYLILALGLMILARRGVAKDKKVLHDSESFR